ncbi:MAG TPA: EAL domain-containing protein, partial [Methylophilaceae bacterium]|nr:EAL domain-containing protein [Methylophilaceae bacterium]
LRKLVEQAVEARTAQEACEISAAALADSPHDLPFVLIYLLDADGSQARLAGMCGLEKDSAAAPALLALDDARAAWPLRHVLESGAKVEIHELTTRFGELSSRVWPEPVRQAVVMPMPKQEKTQLSGFVVAGLSPRLAYNEDYCNFLKLMTGHIAAAVTHARSFEEAQWMLNALLENAPEGIMMAHGAPDFPIVASSRVALELLGKTAAETIGLPTDRHFSACKLYPADSDTVPRPEQMPLYRATRYGESVQDEEWTIKRDDGQKITVQVNATPIKDSTGAIIGGINCWRNITERKQMEESLRRSEANLAKELQAMSHLHDLSSRLLAAPDLPTALEEVLDASITMLGAQMGNLQLYNPQTDQMEIVKQRGFRPEFLSKYRMLGNEPGTSSSRALQRGERVIIEDVKTDPAYQPYQKIAVRAGYRAVQTTPLISRKGQMLGLLSTHFRQPHRPSPHDLSLLDLYARQAVDFIERMEMEDALRISENKFRTLAEASPALIWQLDPDGNAVYLNPRYEEMFGIPTDNLLGASWLDPIHPDDAPICIAAVAKAQREQSPLQHRMRTQDKHGEWRWLEANALPWYTKDGVYVGHVGIAHDITETVRAQTELSISNERLKLAIEGAGDGIWDWDIPCGQLMYSLRLKQIIGFAEDEIADSYQDWKKRIHPDDLSHVQSALRACMEGVTPSFSCEYRILCKNGSWKWVLSRAIVVARDAKDNPLRMTGTVTDISEKRRMDEMIWRHANFDSLTTLPNRRLFRDRLGQALKKAHRTHLPMGLFFIDLDQFKEVNDLLGHDIGDQLLVEAAKRICSCVRQSDTVARLGGDEFTAILTELDDVAHVEQVAQKMIATLSEPFHLNDEVIYLTASLGITLYPNDADNAEELIRNADQAMYAAKNAGRNQFNYFKRSMQESAHARLRLIGDLRNALEASQLKVYYQPVVDMYTGKIVKAEALLRWHHPQLGMVEPQKFIPLAEESGLIHEIGNWVFSEAVARSKRWSAKLGRPFQIGVNKSPVQFLAHPNDFNKAQPALSANIKGSSMSVEITEGLLLNASNNVTEKLLEYRDAGIQIAIDDFGTGYSSMAYLRKFDIDYLKIDQSFICDMAEDPGDRAIVRSIILMAHELGLKVVAEGIETVKQMELLVEAGCDYGQGFLFSKALPPDKLEQMLLTGI